MGIYGGVRVKENTSLSFRKPAAVYSIIVGIGMIGIWVMLLLTRQDAQLQNELQTIPFSISMAIASDVLTAIVLLIGGVGLVRRSKWAIQVFHLAMGFLFYSVINAIGLYGQRGEIPFLLMFGLILVLAVLFTVLAFRKRII